MKVTVAETNCNVMIIDMNQKKLHVIKIATQLLVDIRLYCNLTTIEIRVRNKLTTDSY